MFIVGIEGSPRKNGNTEQLVSTVLDGAKDAGATTKFFKLADMDIGGVSYALYQTDLPGMPRVNIDIDGKVLYQHFAPSKSHPSPFHISSKEAITGALTDAEKALSNDYVLFVGAHYPAKGTNQDLAFQIE